ncbi:cellulase family glycosylhydrolase [Streptomyces paludis]|uniref:Endoglucanase n=1 Tax=Streptomyces paludis TaxID=2282738 RepID=A0A345HIE6_9ACTN|nr:cellulase family glycosylhydrolase [Streptomyces paludis]AXG76470.1 cellulose-binding protein [Streptomyces paludis]
MRAPPRTVALLAAAALAVAGTALIPQAVASGTAAATCTVEYSTTSQWNNGFQGGVTLTNNGAPVQNWTLTFDFPGSQQVTQGWNGKWSQSGRTVTVVNETWNGAIPTGGSLGAGFTATWSGSNPAPTVFKLNGATCDVPGGPGTPTDPPTTPPTGPPTDPAGVPPTLRVSGNKLVDQNGATRRMLGVNRSGGEFMCIQGHGFFDGPVDDASVKAIADWKVNTVRVPLNEECWLGLSHVNPAYSGANYIAAVKAFVARLKAHNITPVVELHWTNGTYTGGDSHCPGSPYATCQKPMPNAQYTPAFWTSVANTFKGDPAVVFDLFNEPFPDRATSNLTAAWTCWRDGGNCPGIDFPVAGMQSLVNAVRATGAQNLVLVPGLAYGNDMRQWLQYRPTDPAGNLAAAWHTYNFNTCSNESCWNEQLAPVIAQVPLVAGEIGENTCGHSYIDRVMSWLDGRGASYLGWTWNTWDCSSGPSLISDYSGTPTNFGVGLRDHLKGIS